MDSGNEGGKNNHPQEHEKEATGSSRGERPEIIARDASNVSKNSEDIELHPEVTDARQGEGVDGNGGRTSLPKQLGEAKTEGDSLSGSESFESFSSSSSRSLTIAPSEDLFRVDTTEFNSRSISFYPEPNEDSRPVLDDKIRSPGTSSSQEDTSSFSPRSSISFSHKPNEDNQPVLDFNIGPPGTSLSRVDSSTFSHLSSFSFSHKLNEDNQPVSLSHVDTRTFSARSSISFSYKLDEDSQPELDCNITSQVSNSIPEPLVNHSMSPTQTPPIQMMDRSDAYGSGRISLSVTESSNTMPRKNSAGSNDSLFSLPVGTGSFSRELFLFSGQGKSEDFENQVGEIRKSEESGNKSGEFFMFTPPSPLSIPVPTLELDRKSVEEARNSEATRVMGKPAINSPRKSARGERHIQFKEELARYSSASSSHSDGSSSSHPLTQPMVKKKKSRCPSFSCFSCSWMFCRNFSCKWMFCRCSSPNCCSRWPKCSCPDCSWMFCCRRWKWNCTKKMWSCSCCIPKRSSKSEGHEMQQKHKPLHQPESPSHKAHPKSSAHKCFPSFNCCI